MNGEQLETATRHFLAAAIWADADEGTSPRVTRESRAEATRYVWRFVTAQPDLVAAVLAADGYGAHPDFGGDPAAAFGHDLYLTARGHGVGFWCRDELEDDDLGRRISDALTRGADWREWYVEPHFYRGWLYF